MTLPSGSSGPLSDRSSFRRFPVEFRRRIVAEYLALPAYSVERGELLRREGVTAGRVFEWARQASVKDPSPSVRAGRASKRSPEHVEIDRLKRENERLSKVVKRQETVISILGKTHALLEQLSESADNEPRSPQS
jgi:transposase